MTGRCPVLQLLTFFRDTAEPWSGVERSVAVAIADRVSWRDGAAAGWVSIEQLELSTGWSRRAVQRAVTALLEGDRSRHLGALFERSSAGDNRLPLVYRLLLGPSGDRLLREGGVPHRHPQGCHTDTPGVPHSHPPLKEAAPHSSPRNTPPTPRSRGGSQVDPDEARRRWLAVEVETLRAHAVELGIRADRVVRRLWREELLAGTSPAQLHAALVASVAPIAPEPVGCGRLAAERSAEQAAAARVPAGEPEAVHQLASAVEAAVGSAKGAAGLRRYAGMLGRCLGQLRGLLLEPGDGLVAWAPLGWAGGLRERALELLVAACASQGLRLELFEGAEGLQALEARNAAALSAERAGRDPARGAPRHALPQVAPPSREQAAPRAVGRQERAPPVAERRAS